MAWSWWGDFEKIMCGKWIGEQIEINGNPIRIFLHIEQTETEVTVKFDFNDDSFENTAFYVEYSDDMLYFFHNDKAHRAEYVLTIENDDLIKCKFSVINCWGYSGKFEKDFNFTRLEKLSEDEYEKYSASNKIRPKSASRLEVLKEYAEYGDIKTNAKFTYNFDERENLLDVIAKYNLDELVKGKNDVDTAIALMHWFCGRYRHGNPPGGLAKTRTPQGIMEFADNNGGKTNCRGLSLALAQLIRAFDIKAFHITCKPYEQPFDDCHVVVCVYCESLKKYIMLDPSANLYIKNKDNEIIGVDELRDILLADGELIPNEEATNWGNDGRMAKLDDYRDYMAKNLIRIERCIANGYGYDRKEGSVTLIPSKYMEVEANHTVFYKETKKNFMTSRESFWQV